MVRSLFGVIGAGVVVLFFGFMLYHFVGIASPGMAFSEGLGPTIAGVGLLFLIACIGLLYRFSQLFTHGNKTTLLKSADRLGSESGTGFDADEAISRYLERKSIEQPQSAVTPPSEGPSIAPAQAKGFGRRA